VSQALVVAAQPRIGYDFVLAPGSA